MKAPAILVALLFLFAAYLLLVWQWAIVVNDLLAPESPPQLIVVRPEVEVNRHATTP